MMKFYEVEDLTSKVGHKSSQTWTDRFLNWIRDVFKLKYKKFKNWDQEDLKLLEEANKIR